MEALALAYAARFATSTGKLDAYLRRKLRERGWVDDGEPPVAVLVARFVAAGYVDDAAWAQGKAHGLARRGYGAGRVEAVLRAAGIAEDLRLEAGPSPIEQRRAALALAQRRGFGPFGTSRDRATREKQLAALLRAGHPLDFARELVNAHSTEAAEEWAGGQEDEQPWD